MTKYYYKPRVPLSFEPKTKRLPQDWWLKSRVYTLHKPAKHKFPTRPTLTSAPNRQFQADLMDLQKYKRKNQGFAYILVVIDIFSRKLFAFPLKNKQGKTVSAAFVKLFRSNIPTHLQTDDGTEFFNSHMNKLLKKHKVKLFSVKSQFKASLAERVIRTIKTRLWRYFTHQGSYQWVKVLPDLVASYNDTPHSSLPDKLTPNQAAELDNWYSVWNHQENRRPSTESKLLQMNDYVRISRIKALFDKGYLPSWSEEIFQVVSVDSRASPVMYQLKDHEGKFIQGKFYTEELQKVAKPELFAVERVIRRGRRRGEALVKFFDSPNYYYATDLQQI